MNSDFFSYPLEISTSINSACFGSVIGVGKPQVIIQRPGFIEVYDIKNENIHLREKIPVIGSVSNITAIQIYNEDQKSIAYILEREWLIILHYINGSFVKVYEISIISDSRFSNQPTMLPHLLADDTSRTLIICQMKGVIQVVKLNSLSKCVTNPHTPQIVSEAYHIYINFSELVECVFIKSQSTFEICPTTLAITFINADHSWKIGFYSLDKSWNNSYQEGFCYNSAPGVKVSPASFENEHGCIAFDSKSIVYISIKTSVGKKRQRDYLSIQTIKINSIPQNITALCKLSNSNILCATKQGSIYLLTNDNKSNTKDLKSKLVGKINADNIFYDEHTGLILAINLTGKSILFRLSKRFKIEKLHEFETLGMIVDIALSKPDQPLNVLKFYTCSGGHCNSLLSKVYPAILPEMSIEGCLNEPILKLWYDKYSFSIIINSLNSTKVLGIGENLQYGSLDLNFEMPTIAFSSFENYTIQVTAISIVVNASAVKFEKLDDALYASITTQYIAVVLLSGIIKIYDHSLNELHFYDTKNNINSFTCTDSYLAFSTWCSVPKLFEITKNGLSEIKLVKPRNKTRYRLNAARTVSVQLLDCDDKYKYLFTGYTDASLAVTNILNRTTDIYYNESVLPAKLLSFDNNSILWISDQVYLVYVEKNRQSSLPIKIAEIDFGIIPTTVCSYSTDSYIMADENGQIYTASKISSPQLRIKQIEVDKSVRKLALSMCEKYIAAASFRYTGSTILHTVDIYNTSKLENIDSLVMPFNISHIVTVTNSIESNSFWFCVYYDNPESSKTKFGTLELYEYKGKSFNLLGSVDTHKKVISMVCENNILYISLEYELCVFKLSNKGILPQSINIGDHNGLPYAYQLAVNNGYIGVADLKQSLLIFDSLSSDITRGYLASRDQLYKSLAFGDSYLLAAKQNGYLQIMKPASSQVRSRMFESSLNGKSPVEFIDEGDWVSEIGQDDEFEDSECNQLLYNKTPFRNTHERDENFDDTPRSVIKAKFDEKLTVVAGYDTSLSHMFPMDSDLLPSDMLLLPIGIATSESGTVNIIFKYFGKPSLQDATKIGRQFFQYYPEIPKPSYESDAYNNQQYISDLFTFNIDPDKNMLCCGNALLQFLRLTEGQLKYMASKIEDFKMPVETDYKDLKCLEKVLKPLRVADLP